MLVKVGATLGVMAAVGGPILLAVSAFMKMKVAITAISVAMKALAASSGPIGLLILAVGALAVAWTTNFGGIRDFTIAVVGKVTEALGWLWDKVKWVLEKLGLYKEKIEEINPATSKLAKVTGEAAEKFKKAGVEAKEAAPGVDTLADSMGGLAEKTDEAKGVMDEFDWTDRLAEEEKQRQEEATKKLEEEKEKQKTILERFAEVKKSIADRTYELTHTAMEVSIRDLNRQKEAYLKQGQSQKEVDKWYQTEIDKLNELHPVKDEAIEDNNDLADSNTKLAKSIEPIIEKTKEAGETTKEVAKNIITSWEGLTMVIKRATVSLSNFSKEGIAAAIAQIKMKFLPRIAELREELSNLYTGYFRTMTKANIEKLTKQMNEQIDIIMLGQKTYQEALASLGGGSDSGSSVNMPSYATGTPYVPKTGLALVHKGEKITPASQNSYDQRKSYSNSINIQPGAINIVTPKFSSLDGQELFRQLERQIKMRGLKLVRA